MPWPKPSAGARSPCSWAYLIIIIISKNIDWAAPTSLQFVLLLPRCTACGHLDSICVVK